MENLTLMNFCSMLKFLLNAPYLSLCGKIYNSIKIINKLSVMNIYVGIILKWIFEKWDGRAWTGSIWLRIETGGEFLSMR